MPDHIFQKKGQSTWYVKLDIPVDVRRALGNHRALTHTLKTGLRSEAMERRLPWLTQWKADIRAAREQGMEAREQWRANLAKASLEIDSQIDSRLLEAVKSQPKGKVQAPEETQQETVARLEQFERGRAEIIRDAQSLEDAGAEGLVKRLNSLLSQKPLTLLDEVQATAEITRDVMSQVTKKLFSLTPTEAIEATEIMYTPTSYKPRSPITSPMIEDWAKHLVTQIESGKTRDSHKARIEKISKFLTIEGASLSFDTIHKFLTYQSGARQTLSNYLWSGRDFWKWAIKYNAQFRDEFKGQLCPFDGHELPKTGQAAGESYIPFTREEVEQLHRMAKEKGKKDLEDLIVFAAYTGARLEEIGRLKLEDTMFDENGEPIGFRITEAKTAAGVREVPLNPALVALYKDRSNSASQNNGYLFKGGANKNGNRLDGLGKQFGRLKSKAFSRLHVFHSIRKTATTLLHQAGVGMEVVPYIIGHENPSFTFSVYSAGCSFKQKQGAINLLSYSFQ